MTYASQDDLVERFGTPMLLDLTDRAKPPAGVIDSDVVARALADTDAAINGYLKARYVLPISPTPDLLRDLAVTIAVYKLHRDSVSDKIRLDYADALKQLALISTGAIRLDVAGIEPPTSDVSGVRTNDRARDFTPDNLKGYV